MTTRLVKLAFVLACSMLANRAIATDSLLLDQISFGNEASEKAHSFAVSNASVQADAALGQPALVLAASSSGHWAGGSASFRVTVDPSRRNYVSVRLWGGEVAETHLILFCDGLEVGDRALGDIDILDFGAVAKQFPGEFFYRTTPLPLSLTKDKQSLDCRLESSGAISSYANTFEQWQKPMKQASRGIYGLYVHADGFLPAQPGVSEGSRDAGTLAPGNGLQIRGGAGMQVLGELRARIEQTATKLLANPKPLGQHELEFLAGLKEKTWTKLAQDPRIVPTLLKGLDAFAAAYVANPRIVADEKSTFNPDWFAFGPVGGILARHADWFSAQLDEQIPWKDGKTLLRRKAYSEMPAAGRDYQRRHRRSYTNQSMIIDTYGIYLSNRGIAAIDPEQAMPEAQALRYLYESMGLEPWSGPEPAEDGTPAKRWLPKDFHLVTHKGLTRELGYVGSYGEVLDWAAILYDATRPAPHQAGDARIRDQLVKLALARGYFRYPSLDEGGYRTMRVMTDIGWRDLKSPGDIAYLQRFNGGSAVQLALKTRDPELIGYAQQMLIENQLFPALQMAMKDSKFRVTYGLLDTLDEVAELSAMAPQPYRLPMSDGQPDFAFADPENGVVAVHRGAERFYASLYYRANFGINQLGRVYLSGPRGNRIATVEVQTEFTPSGQVFKRPQTVNRLRNSTFNKGYGDIKVAGAGEELPIAAIPEGVDFKIGDDSVVAGRGDFYILHYAGYVIAINMSQSKSFSFIVPKGVGKELVSGRDIAGGTPLKMEPLSSLVFYTGD